MSWGNCRAHILSLSTEELAQIITKEQGKTIPDSKGDIFRGFEVVEIATSIPSMVQGETLPGVATGVDVHSYRVPLGVCAGIAPFNFPAMIPLWMFPMAVTAGNSFLMKPSERVPQTAMRLAEMAVDCGRFPNCQITSYDSFCSSASNRGARLDV